MENDKDVRQSSEQSFYCSLFIANAGIIMLKTFPTYSTGILLGAFTIWIFSLLNNFFAHTKYQNYHIRNRISLSSSYMTSLVLFSIAIIIAIWVIIPKTDFRSRQLFIQKCINLTITTVVCETIALILIFIQFYETTTCTLFDATHLLFGRRHKYNILIYNKEDFFDCIRYYSNNIQFHSAYSKLMRKFDSYRNRGLDPYIEHIIWLEEQCGWCYFSHTPQWRALHLTFLEYQIYNRWEDEAILILMFCDIGFERTTFTISINREYNHSKKCKSESVRCIRKRFEKGLKSAIRNRAIAIPTTMVKLKP